MKITFHQSGGYAGLMKRCEIDTNLLSFEEAKKLETLVTQSKILTVQSKRSLNVADVFNYHIVIETSGRTHQISFDEKNLPEEVIPLLDFLEAHSYYFNKTDP